MATAVSSKPGGSHVIRPTSIRAWPDQAELARRIEAAGWLKVRWRNLTGIASSRCTAAVKAQRPASAST